MKLNAWPPLLYCAFVIAFPFYLYAAESLKPILSQEGTSMESATGTETDTDTDTETIQSVTTAQRGFVNLQKHSIDKITTEDEKEMNTNLEHLRAQEAERTMQNEMRRAMPSGLGAPRMQSMASTEYSGMEGVPCNNGANLLLPVSWPPSVNPFLPVSSSVGNVVPYYPEPNLTRPFAMDATVSPRCQYTPQHHQQLSAAQGVSAMQVPNGLRFQQTLPSYNTNSAPSATRARASLSLSQTNTTSSSQPNPTGAVGLQNDIREEDLDDTPPLSPNFDRSEGDIVDGQAGVGLDQKQSMRHSSKEEDRDKSSLSARKKSVKNKETLGQNDDTILREEVQTLHARLNSITEFLTKIFQKKRGLKRATPSISDIFSVITFLVVIYYLWGSSMAAYLFGLYMGSEGSNQIPHGHERSMSSGSV